MLLVATALAAWGIGGMSPTVLVADLPHGRAAQATLATAPACTIWFDRGFLQDTESGVWPQELLENVAAHEALHCIGLEHSTDPESLMYPVVSLSPGTDADWDALREARPPMPYRAAVPMVGR